MFKLFTKIFGSKYERDVKAYSPIVEIINEFATQYQSLTNDELRNKTAEFQDRIKESLKEIDAEIATLRQDAEETLDFNLKEELYKELDEAIKTRDKDLEEVLRTLLPQAFAVVKETTRRFVQNPTLSVQATDHDRNMAARKAYVTIEGDKANWKNEWMVTPPALMAATPVGATMAVFLKQLSRMYFRKVVLPVPALPVRKRCLLVWFTKATAF